MTDWVTEHAPNQIFVEAQVWGDDFELPLYGEIIDGKKRPEVKYFESFSPIINMKKI